MPTAGETRMGQHIGKTSGHRFVWVLCGACGEGRWVGSKGQFQVKPRLCQGCYLEVQKAGGNRTW